MTRAWWAHEMREFRHGWNWPLIGALFFVILFWLAVCLCGAHVFHVAVAVARKFGLA